MELKQRCNWSMNTLAIIPALISQPLPVAIILSLHVVDSANGIGSKDCFQPVWSSPSTTGSCDCTTVYPDAHCTGSIRVQTTGYWYCVKAPAGWQECPVGDRIIIGSVQPCVKDINVGRLIQCIASAPVCGVTCGTCQSVPTLPTCAVCIACLAGAGVNCAGCNIYVCAPDPTAAWVLYNYNRTWQGVCP